MENVILFENRLLFGYNLWRSMLAYSFMVSKRELVRVGVSLQP